MAVLKSGTCTNFNQSTGFATMKSGEELIAFHLTRRRHVHDNDGEIQFLPISEVNTGHRDPRQGDSIRYAESEDNRGLRVRFWVFGDDLGQIQWQMKPLIYRCVEQVLDKKNQESEPIVLWTGSEPSKAYTRIMHRKWLPVQPENDVQVADLGNGLVLKGWWQVEMWDGSWQTVPTPYKKLYAPANGTPVLVS